MTDTVTGLIWLKQWDCVADNTWAAANQAAAALNTGECGLTDNSSAGDWRLPTKEEWSATIARAVALGCKQGGAGEFPSLTNDAGTACYGNGLGSSFAGVASDKAFWANTTYDGFPDLARLAHLRFGDIGNSSRDNPFRVWPVRGGPR